MRTYAGDRHQGNEVWVFNRRARPEVSEINEVLGELLALNDVRGAAEYDDPRADYMARKEDLISRIRAVEEAGPPVPLVHRVVHSPTGFEWGYKGSGPSDLALSILTVELGEQPPADVYLKFRDDVVAGLGADFELDARDVWVWIADNRELVETKMYLEPRQSSPGSALSVTAAPAPEAADVDEPTASALVQACERAWADIQAHHPDLPDAVIILGSGVERGRLVKLGHWWGGRWLADGEVRGEVLLAGEALRLEPAQVFEVLLHEAAHGLNAARGVKDTSREGRYHNQRFGDAAREVLLRVRPMPPYGMASTLLSDAAAERYGETIARLAESMRIVRQLQQGVRVGAGPEGPGQGGDAGEGRGTTRRASSVAASCPCGRRLRMAPSVMAAGPVVCGLCGSEFSRPLHLQRERVAERPDAAVVEARLGVESAGDVDATVDDLVAFREWYHRFGGSEERPMPAADPEVASRRVELARAALRSDGVLEGPELVTRNGLTLATGDRVVSDGLAGDGVSGLTLGSVESLDLAGRRVGIDFPTWGQVDISADGLLVGSLAYDYVEHITLAPLEARPGRGGSAAARGHGAELPPPGGAEW